MTKKLVSYDDIQEALRLTSEAEAKVVVASGTELTARSATMRVMENFAASLKQVSIEELKPFRGQAFADMAITHTDRAAQLLRLARGTNDAPERLRALMEANEHLDEARRMIGSCAVKVNEELMRKPGEAVKLGDDFDVKAKVPTL